LNINDDGGFAEFFSEALVLAAELLHFLLLRVPLGLGTALVRSQTLENAGMPLATPGDEVREVKAFAALQGANGARLSGCGIGLSQNPKFVLSGEGATLGIRDHLWVWSRRACVIVRMAPVMAACPLAKASAAAPPSSAARRFSSTSLVGFISRE
jgi:hypothetical protein